MQSRQDLSAFNLDIGCTLQLDFLKITDDLSDDFPPFAKQDNLSPPCVVNPKETPSSVCFVS